MKPIYDFSNNDLEQCAELYVDVFIKKLNKYRLDETHHKTT